MRLAAFDRPAPGTVSVGDYLRLGASFALVSLGAVVMVAVAIPTLGLARRLYTEWIARAVGVAVLRTWGIRFRVHRLAPVPPGQVVYVSNHSSSIDTFLLIALGLPRTRYFWSGFIRRILPLGVMGTLMRIFWTVPQDFPEERRRIFQRAAGVLRRSGDSVYLSPEGKRVTSGEIGHFNKGAFHLATSLRAPVVPLYLSIPPAMDPGRGFAAKPGIIDVYVLAHVPTDGWDESEAAERAAEVREAYVRIHEAARRTGTVAPETSTLPLPTVHEGAVA